MALFKIYKDKDSDKLTNPSNSNYVPKVDGHCYFDTSTGLFYIDAITDVGSNGENIITRAPLNSYKAIKDKDGNDISSTYMKKNKLTFGDPDSPTYTFDGSSSVNILIYTGLYNKS